MKIRSLKQVLHWLFLAVGVFSLFMLPFSVSTYVNYTRSGYGLEISISDAWINYDWLVLKVVIDNPGGLDMELETGNVTLIHPYTIPHQTLPSGQPQNFPLDELPKGDSTTTLIWVQIGSEDLGSIRDTGHADVLLDLIIFIPERYARTQLTCHVSALGVEL